LKLDRDNLIRARERLGYAVETVAEEAGVSKNSVLRAEHGKDIRPLTARKIAAALGVRVADLIRESETLKADRPLTAEWALSVVDKDTFRQAVAAASTEDLQQLVVELVGDYQPRLFNDVRGTKPSPEDVRRVMAFSDAMVVAEELVRRGEEAPETYLLALKRYMDRVTRTEERREIEPEVAGLFRNLAKRARLIAETSRRQGGPSAELGEQVELLYEEAAHVSALRRLLPRWGAESDELADAVDAYQEAESVIQAMLRQDLDATDEERREARRFRSGGEESPGSREANAS
jgi:transcriptional regulator with XRE-family HTH domain